MSAVSSALLRCAAFFDEEDGVWIDQWEADLRPYVHAFDDDGTEVDLLSPEATQLTTFGVIWRAIRRPRSPLVPILFIHQALYRVCVEFGEPPRGGSLWWLNAGDGDDPDPYPWFDYGHYVEWWAGAPRRTVHDVYRAFLDAARVEALLGASCQ